MKIYRYRIPCNTCGCFQYVWIDENQDAPTKCPVSDSHEVDSGGIEKTQTVDTSSNVFEIRQNELLDPATASTMEEGIEIDIETGQNPSILTLSFPFVIDLLGAKFFDSVEDGDKIDAYGMPLGDSPIGIITQEASSGQDYIYANSTVIDNAKQGVYLKLGSNSDEYMIKSIDSENSKITFTTNLANNHSVNDYIYIRYYWCKNRFLYGSSLGTYDSIGMDVIIPAGLPPEQQILLKYYHKTDPVEDSKKRFILIYRY